jgi:hypothetical protein
MFKHISLLSLSLALLSADGFYNAPNTQGYTGVINIPTAEVTEDGKIDVQFSNQVDAVRVKDSRDEYEAQHYFLNFGFLPNLEITGRLANIEDKVKKDREFLDRDLSASFKYQVPYYDEYLPKLAVGVQDISGNDRYNAKYIVATKQYSFVRGTVGFGFGSQWLDGLFAGIELKANDWFYLLSDYDTQQTNVGVRIGTPKGLFDFGEISLLAKTNLDDDNDNSFALNFKINLGLKHHNTQEYDTSITNIDITPQTNYTLPNDNYKTNQIDRLKDVLVNFGFENIDIGDTPTKIYVAYENNIFDHNELDALGTVLGYMVQLDLPHQTFEIVIKKSNQKVKKVIGNLGKYKNFLKSLSQKSMLEFEQSLHVNSDFTDIPLKICNANSSYFKTRAELGVGLNNYVAVEISVYEYLVSARPYFHWNLYKGLDLGVLADFPLFESDEFKAGGAFQYENKGNKLENIMLHKSDIFGDFVNLLSVGYYDEQYGGFENMLYTLDDHTFKLKLGYFEHEDTKETRDIALATYSYYHQNYDAYIELTAGKYYNQDTGFDLQLKRYFGETLVKLFYQNADEQYVGLGVELPLTPRYVANTPYGQIKGQNLFSHQLRTVVRSGDGQNFVKPGGLITPTTEFEIESRFLNRNRLTEAYVKKHILRLRDVYFSYVQTR